MIKLLLADDDADDARLFKIALSEVPLPVSFTTVSNGEELMHYLEKNASALPDVLFLDLNMPRKNGSECLQEIKEKEIFSNMPVIIFSTSLNPEVADLLYEKGAHYYIRKPGEYNDLVKVIHKALLKLEKDKRQPAHAQFILEAG